MNVALDPLDACQLLGFIPPWNLQGFLSRDGNNGRIPLLDGEGFPALSMYCLSLLGSTRGALRKQCAPLAGSLHSRRELNRIRGRNSPPSCAYFSNIKHIQVWLLRRDHTFRASPCSMALGHDHGEGGHIH